MLLHPQFLYKQSVIALICRVLIVNTTRFPAPIAISDCFNGQCSYCNYNKVPGPHKQSLIALMGGVLILYIPHLQEHPLKAHLVL